jgi:GAF domain-containing protein/HAMP domain-containing protein
MTENQPQSSLVQERQKNISLITAGIFILLGLTFFIYEIYSIIGPQKGHFDFSDPILLPMGALMFLVAIASLLLIQRDHHALGTGLLFYSFVIVPPIAVILLVQGVASTVFLYIVALGAIMTAWLMPKASRPSAILSIAIAIILSVAIELWNPSFRVVSSFENTDYTLTVITIITILALVVFQYSNLSLRLKVIMALVGITVFTVGIIAYYLLNQIYQNAYNATATQITAENGEHILSIQTFLSENSQDVLILSHLSDLKDLIADEESEADPLETASATVNFRLTLQAFFNAHPIYDNVRFIDSEGQEVVKVTSDYISPDLQNDATRPFFAIPAKLPAGSLYMSPLELEQDLGKIIVPNVPVVRFATPVYYRGSLAGVIVADIVSKNFLNILDDPSHHVALVDQNGYYLYDNQQLNKLFGGATDLNTGITIAKDFPAQASSLLSGKSGSFTNQQNVYFYAPITVLNGKTPNWFLLEEVPQSEIYALANRTLTNSMLILIVILFVAIAIAIYLGNSLTASLISLTQTAQEAAQGKLSVRSNVKSNDEIGVLANTFNFMASQLSEQIRTLDQRVSERTQELEHEASRVRSAAEIARDIASAPNLDELLARSSQLIVERFKFYHAGIFLLDNKKEYAVLRASPTEAGKQLIANNHRLRVGAQGIVGTVAATGEARIALDVGADAVYFNNPFLPTTHSEMALPLKTSREIFGVLDIQSDQPQAFVQQDIEILQVLADQLAIAIEKTRLLQQVEDQLKEIEQTYEEYTQRTWKSFAKSENRIAGYTFDGAQLRPINQAPDNANEMSKKSLKDLPKIKLGALQSIPIRLRGQAIGVVNVRLHGDSASSETIAIIEQIADRLASALENARLTEETRQRSQRDRAIAEVSTKISTFSDIDLIMRSAVEELGHRLGSSTEVTLELSSDGQEENL